MAIQFARIKIVGRSSGGNACCKGAYNARTRITDHNTGMTYNFSNRDGNVYHEVLLPEYVDKRFKDVEALMNEVERCENRKDSQLLKEVLLALPDDKELDLEDRIEITKRLIEKRGWVKEGLAVQIDIHAPYDGKKNWHVHILVTTRRFKQDGLGLEDKKAVDLNPEFKKAGYRVFVVPEEEQIHEDLKNIINEYFKEKGLENRVDAIGVIPQEHIGPVRMRSVLNAAVFRNEERRIAEIEYLSSGAAVLDKVTRHMSVFGRGDLVRAVKCISDSKVRERLVEEAIAHKSVIELYTEDGSSTEYFTTAKIRVEEQKILRLSGYVANEDNVFTKGDKGLSKHTAQLIELAKSGLSEEQHIALTELVTSSSGLRILRGRAGVGKSHVLRKVAEIAKTVNVNVIGLAPTHKAKEALYSEGFEVCDTVKGMLFKLANARFSLPKHSLLVVDEAGMIGNDDYKELLRVAATRKCNIILAGDERQLASVQRGGMFEVFADKYGSSTILNIQRQKSEWGRDVAMALSKGNVREGVFKLEQESRINRQASRLESMQALLSDWHKSDYEIKDRLILTVKNKDVAALNHGVRQYLKLDGKLSGVEIEVGGNHYMKGDILLIQKTNKKLGLINGDLGQLIKVTKDKFVVAINSSDNTDEPKIVEFNPSVYSSFRHGYATTVFKAQGAGIKAVYLFHDGFAGLRNAYVALSRHIKELILYVNNESTPTVSHLIKQLSYDPEVGSSLNFYTKEGSETHKENQHTLANMSRLDSILLKSYDFAVRGITKFTDKYLPSFEYYDYQEPKQKAVSVSEVIDNVYEQTQSIGFESEVYEHKLAVGAENHTVSSKMEKIEAKLDSNNISNTINTPKSSLSSKSRFYAKVDYARNKVQREQQKASWSSDNEKLRSEARFNAERIARVLLGEPNKTLSNGRELRFGEHGKIAVRISGEKAGTWYNFSSVKGGDIFALVQDVKSCDFKDAADYLRQSLGIERSSDIHSSSLQLVYDHQNSNVTEKYIKQQQVQIREAKAKQVAVNKLYDNSKEIDTNTIAHRYLSEIRGITCMLSKDIKATEVYNKETDSHLPAVVGFARDKEGNITGAMQILLDSNRGNKADVAIPKKSLGRIAGSFIDLGSISSTDKIVSNDKKIERITIIAEGLETAASVKQALSNDPNNHNKAFKILCSLGISNIKNYKPQQLEKIIIAADNDGSNAITHKTIENAKVELTAKGAFVEVVCPKTVGDFNDILRDRTLGEREIQSNFNGAIARHSAVNLSQYFNSHDQSKHRLSKQDQESIAYIAKFKINEERIVNAYRTDHTTGTLELEQTRKSLEFADYFVCEHRAMIVEANYFGAKIDNRELAVSLVGKSYKEMEVHLTTIRDRYYIIDRLNELSEEKQKAKTPQETLKALKQEQEFLAGLHNNLNPNIHDKQLLNSIQKAYEFKQSNEIGKLYEAAHYAYKEYIISADDLTQRFKSNNHLNIIHNEINTICHKHHCDIINSHYKQLNAGQSVMHQGKKFDSVLEYLEHWRDTVNHNMLPIKHIEQVIEREHNRQQEIDHHHHGLDL